jgi:ATP-binding cassette subfamily C (CFTR/MRP) protein 1
MASNDPSCPEIDDSLYLYALFCRGAFDFTLLFEETILAILPLAILLVIAPFRIVYLFKKKRKVIVGALLPIKIVGALSIPDFARILIHAVLSNLKTIYAALGATHLVLLTLWTLPAAYNTRASIPVQCINVAAALIFCLLSYMEHVYSVRPSFLLNIYLFFTLLFDIARCRTLWLRQNDQYNKTIAIVFTVSTVLKAGLLLLEALEKQRVLKIEYQTYPPEATASIFNRSFFWWLNRLFCDGFSKLITIEDLFSLDKHLLSERYHSELETAWKRGSLKLFCYCGCPP